MSAQSGRATVAGSRRTWHFAAAAFALGALLCLAVLEIATRAVGIAPPLPHHDGFVADSVLPWKMRANRARRGRTDEFDVRYAHNALGFRGGDRPFEKPPGTFRIVGIGDSFTYGIGVDGHATFLARIEAALAVRSPHPVEAINLGIPRYWPEPESLVLEHYGLRFRPDIVIVGVLPNDVADTRTGVAGLGVSRGYLITSRARRLGGIGHWLYLRSHVARVLIGQALAGDTRDGKPELPGEDEDAAWARMGEAFDRMVRLSATVDARIVFLHIPQIRGWMTAAGEDALTPPARLRRFCAARDCQVIDVAPAMQAHPQPDSLYYPKDGHCTEAGHALIARVVMRELEAQGALPVTVFGEPTTAPGPETDRAAGV